MGLYVSGGRTKTGQWDMWVREWKAPGFREMGASCVGMERVEKEPTFRARSRVQFCPRCRQICSKVVSWKVKL